MNIEQAKAVATRLFHARKDELEINPGPTLSPAMISAFRKSIGFPLPSELRAWLTVCNGSPLVAGLWVARFLGVRDKSKAFLDIGGSFEHQEWRTQRWIPFADDGCGQTFLLVPCKALNRSVVCFHEGTSGAEEIEYVVASSLWHFLVGALSERVSGGEEDSADSWPFDRKSTLVLDPDLKRVRGFQFPWQA
ncbi:MAG: hypothetical protein AMXMBFR58_10060 [Phycisphaerae bacterium]